MVIAADSAHLVGGPPPEELRTELAVNQPALAADPDGPRTVEDSRRLVRAQVEVQPREAEPAEGGL